MPRKQINVVSLSPLDKVEQVEEVDVPSNEDEINQIKEAIKEKEAQQEPSLEEQPLLEPKPKRKPQVRKPKVVEEFVEEPPKPVEPVVEVKDEPQKKIKTLEIVKCDKCNKEMTKRTLRYDHPKTCKGAPVNREEIPVQKRAKPVAPPKVVEQTSLGIPDDIIEQEVKKRLNNSIQERMRMKIQQKEERIKK